MSNIVLSTGTQSLDYFNTKAISNSLMGLYEEDFKAFVDYWVYNKYMPRVDTESLTLGSLVDTLLTSPEEFDSRYYVYDKEAPTGQMLQFCKEVFKLQHSSGPISYEDMFGEAYKNVGFKRDKLESIIKRYETEGKDYTECLNNSIGKEVISSVVLDKAKRLVSELKANPYTRLIVNIKNNENVEVINQLVLNSEWEKDGIKLPLKACLDKVIIDHKKKRIIPIDIKTSSDSTHFSNSVYKYKYYRQGSFYKYMLESYIKERGLEDYVVTDFLFLVCSTTSYDNHFFYKLSGNDIKVARYGGKFMNNMRVKGFEEILNEIVYMTKSKNWKYPYEVQICNGIVELNLFQEYEETGE